MSSPKENDSELTRKCPFCSKDGFKRLGNHLPHCQERIGKDYSQYLSAKTLTKKSKSTNKLCPKCHRHFKRLDTHLRNSATCRDLSSPTNSSDVVYTNLPHGRAYATTPSAILNLTPTHYQLKAAIKLPSTQEEWEDANSYFKHTLVPRVLTEPSPDAKSSMLSEGIYNFFASNYGTRQTKRKKKRQEKYVQALNIATRLKNEARKELRQAKANDSISQEEVMSLARKFFQMLRAHSQQCKRTFNRTMRPKTE